MDVRTLIDAAVTKCGSRAALARALRVPAPNVTQWANGTRPCPDEKIARMAQLAGLPVEETWHAVAWARLGKLVATALSGVVATLLISAAGVGVRPAEAATEPNV
jgi:DNA-binding transcriptional regulator YdaS (Cro superfamily)